MSGRSYLSIGDVLTMLREEFPDVTISKIRFLESQGLVNPERSPSGYRKFFETDVERLRWVLRQQREHFLPLKVIRDRLAAGDLSDHGADGAAAGETAGDTAGDIDIDVADVAAEVPDPVRRNGKVGQVASRQPAASVAGGTTAGGGSRGGLGTGARSWSAGAHSESNGSAESDAGSPGHGYGDEVEGDQLTQADNEAMARILADASRRAALLPDLNPGAGAGAGSGAAAAAGAGTNSGMGSAAKTSADPGGAPERTPLRVVEDPDPVRPPTKVSSIPTSTPTPSQTATPRAPAPAAPTGGPGRTPNAAPGKSEPAPASRGAGGTGSPGRAAERAGATTAVASSPADVAGKSTESTSMSTGTASGSAAHRAKESSAADSGAPRHSSAPSNASGGSMSGLVSGASLTSEELCAASGLSEVELAGLQGFGLIEGEVVAGILTFNEDALTVANLASQFRKFGIEPRHLKQYRNAVDREMGLIEQVIIPLLRQRNPESRQRAVEGADELAGLGQTMRAALLRASLRRHLGG